MTLRRRASGLAFFALIWSAAIGWGRSEPKWLRASAPEITIITTLNERKATARAREFSQYVAALRAYFGPASGGNLAPLTMVVFDRDRDFRSYRPIGKDGKPQEVAGFFVRRDSWSVIGLSAEKSREARHVIFHEGVHWFLNGSNIWLPPWLDEGMAEVFSTFETTGDAVRWGREVTPSLEELHKTGLEPIRHLLYLGRDDLFKNDGDTGIFYAQSWLFVHYLIFGQNRLPKDSINRYAALMLAGADPDQAFTRAFGQNYREMDRQLKEYLRAGAYHLSRRPLAPTPAVEVRPATAEEVDEALGRLALVGQNYARATDRGNAMIARLPGDARGHALLANALKESGQEDAAGPEFAAAASYGSTDFQPYFEAARLLQDDADTMTSPETARQAADYYERAIALYPAYEPSYNNLAGLVALAEPTKTLDQVTLQEGSRRFPKNLMVQLGQAQLTRYAGDRNGARKMLDRVLAQTPAPPPKVMTYARRIQAAWDTEELIDEVRILADAQKFSEALQRLDARAVPAGIDPAGAEIANLRRQMESAARVQTLNAAFAARDWDSARKIAEAILESAAPAVAKNEAKRVRAKLDEAASAGPP